MGRSSRLTSQKGRNVTAGQALVEIDPRALSGPAGASRRAVGEGSGAVARCSGGLRTLQAALSGRRNSQATVGHAAGPRWARFEGAIKADNATIDNAKLQIMYSHITAPISGRVGLRLVDMGNMVHATDTNGLLVITQLQADCDAVQPAARPVCRKVMARMKKGGADHGGGIRPRQHHQASHRGNC